MVRIIRYISRAGGNTFYPKPVHANTILSPNKEANISSFAVFSESQIYNQQLMSIIMKTSIECLVRLFLLRCVSCSANEKENYRNCSYLRSKKITCAPSYKIAYFSSHVATKQIQTNLLLSLLTIKLGEMCFFRTWYTIPSPV